MIRLSKKVMIKPSPLSIIKEQITSVYK